jgi:hypothetical protein
MCHAQFVSVAAAVVDHGDARVSINVLETLQSLFDVSVIKRTCTLHSSFVQTVQPVDGELYAACLEIFESEGGVDKIEALQEHDNNEVYTKALHLITSHFDTNEDDAAALNPVRVLCVCTRAYACCSGEYIRTETVVDVHCAAPKPPCRTADARGQFQFRVKQQRHHPSFA